MSKFLSIRPFTKADFADIISIANNSLGNNYIILAELHSYLTINNKIGLVATVNNQIAGFALAQIGDLDELMKLILTEHNWFKKQFSNYHTIGILKTIAVDPTFLNLGIGTALTKYRINILNKKCDTILAISWEHKQNAANTKILEKCGLSLKLKIENYWQKDSLQKGYNCQTCGPPPCKCAALIYTNCSIF